MKRYKVYYTHNNRLFIVIANVNEITTLGNHISIYFENGTLISTHTENVIARPLISGISTGTTRIRHFVKPEKQYIGEEPIYEKLREGYYNV